MVITLPGLIRIDDITDAGLVVLWGDVGLNGKFEFAADQLFQFELDAGADA
ncbi:MAG: hypothetical protein V9F82_07695 [Dermatophilaceae bacterium]